MSTVRLQACPALCASIIAGELYCFCCIYCNLVYRGLFSRRGFLSLLYRSSVRYVYPTLESCDWLHLTSWRHLMDHLFAADLLRWSDAMLQVRWHILSIYGLLLQGCCYKVTNSTINFYPNVTTLRSGTCNQSCICLSSSLCNVRAPYSAGWHFPQSFYPICTLSIRWPSCKILRRSSRGTPPSGGKRKRGCGVGHRRPSR